MKSYTQEEKNISSPFSRKNYLILLAGGILIILGYILMSGEGSTLAAYNPDIFSGMRIRIAPILCLIGYILNIIGIVKRY